MAIILWVKGQKNVAFVTYTSMYVFYMTLMTNCNLYDLYIAGYQLGTIQIHFQPALSIIWPEMLILKPPIIVLYTNCGKYVFDDSL